jgi:predicted MFS family arabinose efflux permease
MTFLTLAGGATILPFISTFVSKNYAFGTDDLAMMFFYGGLSALVINFVIGSLIDKFGKQNVFLLLNFISMIPLILLTTFPFPDKIQILIVTTSFFCFSTAKTVSGLSLVNSIYPSEHRGRFVTITNSIQLLTGSAATILCGTLLYTENNVIMNFDLLGVIGICATIISIFAAFVVEA